MPRQLQVCVIALTSAEIGALTLLERAALTKILADFQAAATYDIWTDKRVYGPVEEEWAPFEDRKPVSGYVGEAGFDIVPLGMSAALADAKALRTLLDKVELYILDPLLVVLEERYGKVLTSIDAAIDESVRKTGRAAFCLLLPARMPEPFREELERRCSSWLPFSKLAADEGSVGAIEWDTNNGTRLLRFLRKLRVRFEERDKDSPEKPAAIRLEDLTLLVQYLRRDTNLAGAFQLPRQV